LATNLQITTANKNLRGVPFIAGNGFLETVLQITPANKKIAGCGIFLRETGFLSAGITGNGSKCLHN